MPAARRCRLQNSFRNFHPASWFQPQLGAAGGRAVVTWATVANTTRRSSTPPLMGSTVPRTSRHGINTGARTDDIGAVSHFPMVTPTRTAIVWNGPLFRRAGNQGRLPNGDERGVWLDAAGGTVRTPGAADPNGGCPRTWTAGSSAHPFVDKTVLRRSARTRDVQRRALTDERYLLLTEISSFAPTLTADLFGRGASPSTTRFSGRSLSASVRPRRRTVSRCPLGGAGWRAVLAWLAFHRMAAMRIDFVFDVACPWCASA